MSKLIASVSGVRGIFGETLNPIVASQYASHFGQFIAQESVNPPSNHRPRIVVGRDSRTTGKAMLYAIISGLISTGCEVIDLGIVPTPTVLLNVKKHSAQGGISITASHNPPQWNAMKFIDGDGMFLHPDKAFNFLNSLEEEIKWKDWQNIGSVAEDTDAINYHIERILAIPWLNVEQIRSRKFKVVLDSVNGAGGLASPLLLKALGCEVIEINSEPTGFFAHTPEPLNENLHQLEEAVKIHNADLGFATDPDVDRLAIVDEKGQCIGEEYSVALAELFVLPKKLGDIVVNLSSSMLSDYIARKFGVEVHRTKVGEIYVGKLMRELNSPIGGEGNGGIICPDINYTRDALTGMAIILGLLAETNQKLSDIVNSLPRYYIAKAKVELPKEMMSQVLEMLPSLLSDYELDFQDGIKAIAPDHWIHIRKSGTEPVIRVYAESDSLQRSELLCKDIIAKISS
ncbi:MAG: phosphoglucosamine mutase [Candidatus Cloacimonetes bacterium]|jgi:phosphomannomutase|nr:phosphoglucosamine mutase [Candidatus Cloacimonadota bacterium]